MIRATALAIEARLGSTDLEFRPGECVAVVGPNGGGKTSLLRAMAGVEGAAGRLEVEGEDAHGAPPARRRRLLSLLPASRDLTWPIAVRDLVGLGLEKADPEGVADLLRQFELEDLAARPSDSLSTGERARVLMARLLASAPRLLLLDEPLSNLDPYWVIRFLDIIEAHARQGGTVLMSLHDLSHLGRFRRALLVDDGRVAMDETPDALLASPAFERAFRVVGGENGFRISPRADRRSSR